MRAAILAVVIALVAAAASATERRTDELLWMCEGRVSDNEFENAMEQALCIGYIDGAIHADSRWDAASSMMLMNHNVYVQMDGIFRANAAYAQPEAKAQYNVPKKLILAKKAIAEIFEARIPHGKLVAHRELLESV